MTASPEEKLLLEKATPPQHPPTISTERRRLILLAITVAAFMIQLDVTIVNVALPTIQHDLGATVGALEWVLSGYALSLAALIPLFGGLGDRLGHKFVFLTGLVIFGLGSLGCALAGSSNLLVIARVIQGIGGASILALSLAILNQTYPPAIRAHAIGMWAALGGLGFGVGPVVGGLLLGQFGWASIFWVNLPLTALATAVSFFSIPQLPPSGTTSRFDFLGIALACMGLVSITFGLIELTTRPIRPLLTAAPIAFGLLSLCLFAFSQRRVKQPLIPATLLRANSFLVACICYFFSYTAFSGVLYFATLFFQNLAGWSPFRTGLSWLLMNIPFLVIAKLVAPMSKRFSTQKIIVAGCLVAATGVGVLGSLTRHADLAAMSIGYVFSGAGFGALVPCITLIAMRDVPSSSAGIGSAILNCARQLGTATGLSVIGAIGASATAVQWFSINRDYLPEVPIDVGSVISGRFASAVTQPGSSLYESAMTAFLHGYHVALSVCAVLLAGAALIAWVGLKQNLPGDAVHRQP